MKGRKTYTTREICRALDIPERQLIHWAEKGLVEPEVDADGFSSRREYSGYNVYQIAIIKTLWGRVSNKAIKLALLELEKTEDLRKAAYLIITGENVKSTSFLGVEPLLPAPLIKTALMRAVIENDLTIVLNVFKVFKQVRTVLTE